jgi:phosphoenolpyruvate carboxykinase (GTP)
MTAAAAGTVGQVRRDPMAMLPFCGYNMADYFGHWLSMQKSVKFLPAIFHVNWFRKSADGKFLWPGFSDNMRVLKWIVDRVNGRAVGVETPIGFVPRYEDIAWAGLGFTKEQFEQVMSLDREAWAKEVVDQESLFFNLRARLPKELINERQQLISRL